MMCDELGLFGQADYCRVKRALTSMQAFGVLHWQGIDDNHLAELDTASMATGEPALFELLLRADPRSRVALGLPAWLLRKFDQAKRDGRLPGNLVSSDWIGKWGPASALVLSRLVYVMTNGKGSHTRDRFTRKGQSFYRASYGNLARQTGLTRDQVRGALRSNNGKNGASPLIEEGIVEFQRESQMTARAWTIPPDILKELKAE